MTDHNLATKNRDNKSFQFQRPTFYDNHFRPISFTTGQKIQPWAKPKPCIDQSWTFIVNNLIRYFWILHSKQNNFWIALNPFLSSAQSIKRCQKYLAFCQGLLNMPKRYLPNTIWCLALCWWCHKISVPLGRIVSRISCLPV